MKMIAMIFAAGLGTRLKPLTDTMPKALVPVSGKSLLEIQLEKLYTSGAHTIIVNTHHFSNMVIEFLQSYKKEGLTILISDETEKLLNTGGGLKKAGNILLNNGYNESLLIHNVDILDNAHLEDFYQECHEGIDALLMVSERNTKRYLLFDKDDFLVGWTNIETQEVKSPYSDINLSECRKLAFSGMHVVTPQLIKGMDKYPDEFSIIDFYVAECNNFRIKCSIQENVEMVDVGKLDSLKNAENFYQKYYC